MNELSNALTCRIQLLKRAIKQAEKDGEFPEGRLRNRYLNAFFIYLHKES